jgi:hypothetical protein
MSKKHVVALALVVGILMGLVVGVFFRPFAKLTVYSITDIDIIRNPQLVGKEWVYGIWRVYGSTDETQLTILEKELTINNDVLRNFGAINSSMFASSSLYVKISVTDKPYWLLPLQYVGRYLVTPKTCGFNYWESGLSWGIEKDTRQGAVVDAVYADVYKVESHPRVLVIPFAVTAIKRTYSGDIMLKTDYPYARNDSANKRWIIEITDDLTSYTAPFTITFYNPNDRRENFNITLDHILSKSKGYETLGPVENGFLIVTENATKCVIDNYNTFVKDLTKLEALIRWESQNPWKYGYYWFGGGDVFQGTTSRMERYHPVKYTGPITAWWGNDEYKGISTGCVHFTVSPYIYDIPLAEGYYITGEKWNIPEEYPGWYHPHDTSEPGAINISDSDWATRIFPIRPSVLSDQNTKPYGLSLVNYLAAKDIWAPVTNKRKGDFPEVVLDRIKTNVNNEGYGVDFKGAKYKIYCPLNTYHWAFNLDISSELVDTILVYEPKPKPKIVSYDYPKEKIVPGYKYYITVTIKNEGDSGLVGVGIMIPPDCPLHVVSGTGYVAMEASEIKDITITIENLGTLSKDTEFTVKLITGNEYEITDSRTFSLLSSAGVGVEKTSVQVICIDALDKHEVNGLNVEVREKYGNFRYVHTTGEAGDGTALFDLGYFEGTIIVRVYDPANIYLETESEEHYVKAGNNPITVTVYRSGYNVIDWQKYLPYIIGGSIGIIGLAIGVYAVKRRREVWY